MDIALLYFDGCPNWQVAETNLRVALTQVDAPDVAVRRQLLYTAEEAERVRFLGSPTILLDGVDPFPAPGAVPGLSCRLYRTDAGLAGSPTVDQLVEAFGAG